VADGIPEPERVDVAADKREEEHVVPDELVFDARGCGSALPAGLERQRAADGIAQGKGDVGGVRGTGRLIVCIAARKNHTIQFKCLRHGRPCGRLKTSASVSPGQTRFQSHRVVNLAKSARVREGAGVGLKGVKRSEPQVSC
jgi:hypothetical protein